MHMNMVTQGCGSGLRAAKFPNIRQLLPHDSVLVPGLRGAGPKLVNGVLARDPGGQLQLDTAAHNLKSQTPAARDSHAGHLVNPNLELNLRYSTIVTIYHQGSL